MSDPHLLYSVENHIATFTINREAKRNSLSAEAITLFLQHLDEAAADDDVRVVLITGAGEKAFCSGADLGSAFGGGGTSAFDLYVNLMKKLTQFSKPTVAKVNGYCLAGGMGVMLACDLVIAHENAKFGTPEVNVGLWPMMIGALIYRNMLPKQAAEMVLLGQRFDAQQAFDWGMITRVVSAETLTETVNDITTQLAQKSPIGIKLGKEAFYAMQNMPLEEALDYLSGQLMQVIATDDAKEGIMAFMQKRTPNFTGQ